MTKRIFGGFLGPLEDEISEKSLVQELYESIHGKLNDNVLEPLYSFKQEFYERIRKEYDKVFRKRN